MQQRGAAVGTNTAYEARNPAFKSAEGFTPTWAAMPMAASD